MVDLQMKRITAEPIHGLNVKTFYKLFVIITLIAPSAKAQMLEGQLHNQQLTSLDIEQGLSGLAIIYNGIIESAVDGKSTKVKKSNNYYLWDGALSIVFFSEKSPLPYGIYLNRRQQNLLLGMPANANVDIKFGNVDGFIRTELIAQTSKDFIGRNSFEIIFSVQPSLQRLAPQLFETGVASSQVLDPVTEIYALRDAVTHEFFGHPLLHRFHERTDGYGQIIGGVVINPLDLPKANIASKVFSIPEDYLNQVFKTSLKTVGKLPAEFRPLVRKSNTTNRFARNAWIELQDVISLLNGDSDEEVDGYVKAREFIHYLNNEVDDVFSSGSTVLLDPLLRGSYLENHSWLDENRHDLVARIIAFPRVFSNTEMAFALASMVYSLGIGNSSACYFDFHRFANGKLQPEINAALAAHWHLPVKESEIEAVVEILKTALLPSVRSEAIDVLVLLGQIDKVPADRMAAWTDDNLFKAEPKLLRRKLAYLMKTKSGRDYLRGQLTSPAMSAETKDVVKAVITKHVEATKKLKRFDMISEDEVSDLEAAINSQLSVDS
jgi:hypothetical protein